MDLEKEKRRLLGLIYREVEDRKVVDAMARVPREAFVSAASRHLAYEDIPLPIGEGQTVSQPLIVAMMVSMLNLKPGDKVLEVGTGSGYQAAVLSLLANEVITTERFKSLADSARERLQSLGYHNVTVHQAGDVLGRSEDSSFRAIIVAAAAPRLPRVLLEQLSEGGRMVIPVGSRSLQDLLLVTKSHDGYSVKNHGSCRFVPLLGAGAWIEHEAEDVS